MNHKQIETNQKQPKQTASSTKGKQYVEVLCCDAILWVTATLVPLHAIVNPYPVRARVCACNRSIDHIAPNSAVCKLDTNVLATVLERGEEVTMQLLDLQMKMKRRVTQRGGGRASVYACVCVCVRVCVCV